MLNYNKVKKNGQNYIRKFCQRQKIKLFYDCQCGKRYVTFPALYLHFQRKHGKKISTKTLYNNYQVQEKNKCIVLRYNFIQNQDEDQQAENFITYYKSSETTRMIQRFKRYYIEQIQSQKVGKSIEIIEFLRQQIENVFRYSTGISEENFIKDIPIFFNNFVHQLMGKKVELNYYSILCNIILKFGQWLKLNQYTTLQIQYIGFEGQFNLRNNQTPKIN